jgi:GNAT superfamily N-acetyltransferase
MEPRDDLVEIFDRFCDVQLARTRTDRHSVGPFDVIYSPPKEYGRARWAEPRPGTQPTEVELRRLLIDPIWDRSEGDPYLEWVVHRNPQLLRTVEVLGGAFAEMNKAFDLFLHIECDRSFLLSLSPDSFRPRQSPAGVAVRRVDADDDLGVLSRIRTLTETLSTEVFAQGLLAIGTGKEDHEGIGEEIASGITTLVGVVDGHVVALGSYFPEGGSAELRVNCLPEYRKRGVGGALASALAADAFDHGVMSVLVESSSDRLFSSLGFRYACEFNSAEFMHVETLDSDQRVALFDGGIAAS